MLESTLGGLPFPAYAADCQGIVVWQSKSARELVGDLCGTHFTVALPPDDRQRAREAWASVILSGETARTKGFFKGADGQLVQHEGVNAPIRRNGHIVGVYGFAIPSDAVVQEERSEVQLSPRQLDVLRLLVQAKSTRQIADELHLTPETVRNHIRSLLKELGAHSRLQAVLFAIRDGLVSVELD